MKLNEIDQPNKCSHLGFDNSCFKNLRLAQNVLNADEILFIKYIMTKGFYK